MTGASSTIYSTGRFTVQVDARGLLAHEDSEYEEWGFSGSVGYRPSSDGRGLNLKLGSAWGATQSGVQSLWKRQTASGLVRDGTAMDAAQRFQAELGYGLQGRKGRGLWVPFFGAEAAAGGAQALRLGVKLTSGRTVEAGFELGQRAAPGRDPEAAFKLSGSMRW